MLTSVALILLVGMLLGGLCAKIRIPGLLGMLAAGVILGPYVLNLIDGTVLGISADLRQIALVIILTRAGLALDTGDLKRVGRPAVLLCFVPACLEIAGILLLAPPLLGVSPADAALMGSVVAAVSPAVVVPRMLKLMEQGYGKDKGIPQMIMAGASVDDVFVIVLFTALTSLAGGGEVSALRFAGVPVSIATGVAVGAAVGLLFARLFQRVHVRDSAKVVVLLGISLLLVALEKAAEGVVPFSGLLAVMAAGAAIMKTRPGLAGRLSAKYSKLWVAAEVLLFALVGASVDLRYALQAGPAVVVLVLGALVFRGAGVLLCLIGTPLNRKERLFSVIAYLPKATVQAAIGGIPLALGLPAGPGVLAVAVIAIIITAPLGALGIDLTYRRLLERDADR